MQNIQQQQPAQPVVCDNCNKVIDSSYQRPRRNSRINAYFLETQRYARSHSA